MKKLILFIVSFLSGFYSFSQGYENFDKAFNYIFLKPVIITDLSNNNPEIAPVKSKFYIISESKDELEIMFWNWDQSLDYAKVYNYVTVTHDLKKDNLPSNKKSFVLNRSDFEKFCIPYMRNTIDWTSGLAVLPIKLRSYPVFTYAKDFSLGLTAGGKLRVSHYNPTFVNLLYSAGISSVGLDAASTGGKIDASDRAAFSQSIGVVLENHSFQFGIFFGRDRLSASDYVSTQWIYDRKNWVSIGIGYQIFSPDKNKSKQTPKTNQL